VSMVDDGGLPFLYVDAIRDFILVLLNHDPTPNTRPIRSRTWRLLSLLAGADVTHGLGDVLLSALMVTEAELDLQGCLCRAGVPLPAAGAGVGEWQAVAGPSVSRLLGAAVDAVRGTARFRMEDDGESAMLWCTYRRLGEEEQEGGGQVEGPQGEVDLLQVVAANHAFECAFTTAAVATTASGIGGEISSSRSRSSSSSSSSNTGHGGRSALGPAYDATIQHSTLYMPLLLLALVRHEDRDAMLRLLLEAMLTDGHIPTSAGPSSSGLPPLPPGVTPLPSAPPHAVGPLAGASRRTEMAKCFTASGTVDLYLVHRRALFLFRNRPYPAPQPEALRGCCALLRFEVAPPSRSVKC
jgi:hypothetical protein